MKDDLAFMRLWDLYSPLLTDSRREITDLYFNYDLSLGEIAEQKGVSRQSVYDCLQKCRKKLEEYDKKLGFSKVVEDTAAWIEKQKLAHPEWAAELKELEEKLDGAFSI